MPPGRASFFLWTIKTLSGDFSHIDIRFLNLSPTQQIVTNMEILQSPSLTSELSFPPCFLPSSTFLSPLQEVRMIPYSAVLLFLPHFQTREFSQRLKCDSFSRHSYANWESQSVHSLNELQKSRGSEMSFMQGCLLRLPSVCKQWDQFYRSTGIHSIGSLRLQCPSAEEFQTAA